MKELTLVAEITISYKPALNRMPLIATTLDAYVELKEFFSEEIIRLQEEFLVMYLNNGNRVLGVHKLSKGGLTGTIADIRLILGTALKTAACSIILCHNHPSGTLKPSISDIEITKKIIEAGKFMDIRVLDHLIISPDDRYISLSEEGLI